MKLYQFCQYFNHSRIELGPTGIRNYMHKHALDALEVQKTGIVIIKYAAHNGTKKQVSDVNASALMCLHDAAVLRLLKILTFAVFDVLFSRP